MQAIDDEISLPPPPEDDDDGLGTPPPSTPPLEDEDELPDPEDDEYLLDELSLPSLCSEDDNYFCDEIDIDDETSGDSYGEFLDVEDLSDPEDWDDLSDLPPESDDEICSVVPDDDPEENNTAELNLKESANDETEVPLENHIVYGKYFKMLKVGLPSEIVSMKMIQENIDPTLLELDPKQPAPAHLRLNSLGKRHQRGGRIAKQVMMEDSVNAVQPEVVTQSNEAPAKPSLTSALFNCEDLVQGESTSSLDKNKFANLNKLLMTRQSQDKDTDMKGNNSLKSDDTNLVTATQNPAVLVGDNSDEGVERVPLNEHPVYSKYFKMMKFGTPKAALEIKLVQDNINPVILTLDPFTLVNKNTVMRNETSNSANSQKQSSIRKKKVFVSAINNKKLSADSLWNEKDEDIKIDEEEFNKLFTEKVDGSAANVKATSKASSSANTKTTTTLIGMKRAQNASIALARIKMSYAEMSEKILNCDANAFSVEQLRALKEFLPTEEEARLLRAYKGDRKSLSTAEQYMLEMMKVRGSAVIIQALIYQKQFVARWHDCKVKFDIIEKCFDSIKLSLRLKKVLKTILKVVNQLNDENNQGITVESLSKLATIKAFDKKTSVLQYVISLVYRHDPDALLFPEDLKHLHDASRHSLEAMIGEKNLLHKELQENIEGLSQLIESSTAADPATESATKTKETLLKLNAMTAQLDQRAETLQGKFKNILNYFAEDSNTLSHDFFIPLYKFVEEFSSTKKLIDKAKQQEERKLQRHHSAPASTVRRENATVSNGEKVSVADMLKSGMKNLKKVAANETQQTISADSKAQEEAKPKDERRHSLKVLRRRSKLATDQAEG